MKQAILFLLVPLFPLSIAVGKVVEAPLGLPVDIEEVYISGNQVEPIPRTDSSSSLVVRILQVKPAAEGYRYDLSVYGLDPGSHELGSYLRYRSTQAPVENLDLQVQVTTTQPLESLPQPKELEHTPPAKIGGYRTAIVVIAVLWFAVLLAIVFYRNKKSTSTTVVTKKVTLQERLTPLVQAAAAGELSTTDRASLERLLIAHWRKELPEKSLSELREHPEASPLLLQLEQWLHAPNPGITSREVAELLFPYRS